MSAMHRGYIFLFTLLSVHFIVFLQLYVVVDAWQPESFGRGSPKSLAARLRQQMAQLAVVSSLVVMPSLLPAHADTVLRDDLNKYSVLVPDSFTVVKRNVPAVAMSQYQGEEILLSASSFKEVPGTYLRGASVSVTRTSAPRLLKDFNIEWWFAAENSFKDLGSPELVAELLILQRQGEFERKSTVSSLIQARVDDNDQLIFDFLTPLNDNVKRKTTAKAYLRRNQLVVVWVSSLEKFWVPESEALFNQIRDSFTLI